MATNKADMYKQAGIALSLYRSERERQAGRNVHHLAIGAEWMAGEGPSDWPEDGWIWDAMRDAIKAEGGSVRRNCYGGYVESYLDGDMIRTRTLVAA